MIDTRIGSRAQIAFYWFAWSMCSVPWTLAFRWKMGFTRLPRDRPFLLVANHTSLMDPVWAAFWIGRRATFMTSSAVLRVPILRWVLPLCGCFPKAKYVKDRDSMRFLSERYDAGDVIMLFPEGTRTWDGRPQNLAPGIGRLVKRLDAQVVVARILNGHLFQPRWARYPRWLPVRVQHELLELDTERSPEQLTADIAAAIDIDHTVSAPRHSFGFRMAHGLPQYLWACPSCHQLESLEVDPTNGHRVACSGCEETWTLDTSNRMNGRETLRVDEAFDRITAHFGGPPVVCSKRLRDHGIALSTPAARLLRLERGRPAVSIAEGHTQIGREGLAVGEQTFELSELKAISVEIRNTLTFRVDGALFELRVGRESPLKWAHFLRGWT